MVIFHSFVRLPVTGKHIYGAGARWHLDSRLRGLFGSEFAHRGSCRWRGSLVKLVHISTSYVSRSKATRTLYTLESLQTRSWGPGDVELVRKICIVPNVPFVLVLNLLSAWQRLGGSSTSPERIFRSAALSWLYGSGRNPWLVFYRSKFGIWCSESS